MNTAAPSITVEARSVYGVERLYPISGAAQTLAAIAKTRTLTRSDLKLAQVLGLAVVVQVATPAPL